MDQSSTAPPGLSRVRPSVLVATCSSTAAGLESICLAGRGVFPAGLERSRGAGGSPGPWPICSLFIFLHLSITSKINTPWCGGQGAFPWQQRQGPALRVPSTPSPPCPPSRGCPLALGSGLQPHAQPMSHARSRMPDPLPGAALCPGVSQLGCISCESCDAKPRHVLAPTQAGRRFVMPRTAQLSQSPDHSAGGSWGGPRHRSSRPVPLACQAAQENPASAGSRAGREPAAFPASRGSCCSPRQGWQLLPIHPPVCSTWRGGGHVCANAGMSLQQEVVAFGVCVAPTGTQPQTLHTPSCSHPSLCAHTHTDRTSMHARMYRCVQLHTHAHTLTCVHTPGLSPPHTEPSPVCCSFPACARPHRPPAPHPWPCPPGKPWSSSGGLGEPPRLSPSAGGHVWDVQLSTQPLPSVLLPVRARGCSGAPAHGSARLRGERGAEWGFPSLCRHLPVPCLLPACHTEGLPVCPSFAPGTACRCPFVGVCTWAGATEEGRGPSWGLMNDESRALPTPPSSPGGSLSPCSALHVPSPSRTPSPQPISLPPTA